MPLASTSLPDFPVTSHDGPLPLYFELPPVNPAPNGLYAATNWQDDGDGRWLNGVEFRTRNFGGENSFGLWQPAHYCDAPVAGQKKTGERPEDLPVFDPINAWAYDECDPTNASREDTKARAQQILRLEEQVAIEREVGNRLLEDATAQANGQPLQTAADLALAVGYLEAAFAMTNTLGYIHLGAQWAAVAAEAQLLTRSGTKLTSPLGHTFVFGGGYVEALDQHLVATSQPYGWRTEPQLYTALDQAEGVFSAVAERTVLVGYEAVIAAVTIS